eukprot:CAMPEP_0203637226 /NCGR_PEP_ID=MMETSP0088-20131115/3590_1 /ASSEMBLY_ACC=CAM_ASM_001087 /TAXON_ID=426623 /ORGANISM="Chaetoceros affinis, Strain CCMP159" /LENGTH=360 /DNA_ID=CAMNT_0050491589 /DNA_START=122 /DNA_END=1204 /DNA_ORIENTATION=-
MKVASITTSTFLCQALAVYSFLAGVVDAASTSRVVCGGGTNSKNCLLTPKAAPKEERYGARCCSSSPFFLSEFKSKNGCTVHGGTITNISGPGLDATSVAGLYCPWSLTYAEAEAHCTNLGARLCTEAEIDQKCAKATGCKLNDVYVWTSDPTTEVPTASPTSSPTASPTTYPTSSPTASPTASLSASPSASPSATPLEVWKASYIRGGTYADHNYGNSNTLIVSNEDGRTNDRIILAKWDTTTLQGITANLRGELKMYVTYAPSIDREVCIDQLIPNLWYEQKVTWNKITFSGNIKQSDISCTWIKPSDKNTWVTFDIPGSYLTEDSVLDVRIRLAQPIGISNARTQFTDVVPINIIYE